MTKISVIIPVYNIEKYISKCIDSILCQNFEGIEIILVNDGSTDNSFEILEKYRKKYPDIIKVINKKNGGQGSARNEGIKAALGKYISFVDGDDWLDENTYSLAYQIIEKEKADILFWNIKWVYEDGRVKPHPIFPNIEVNNLNKKYVLSDPSPCNKLIKREIFEKNNLFFPENFIYEDFALIPSLSKYASKIVYTDKINYNYRQRLNSTMLQTKYNPKFLDIIKAFDFLKKSLEKTDYYTELEYLGIFQLGYLHSFKFIEYNKHEEIKKCYDYLNNNFPHFKKNKYYLSKPLYFKLYVNLLNKKVFSIAKLLYNVRRKLRG